MIYIRAERLPQIHSPTKGDVLSWAHLQEENFGSLKASLSFNKRFIGNKGEYWMSDDQGFIQEARAYFRKGQNEPLNDLSKLSIFSQIHVPQRREHIEIQEDFLRRRRGKSQVTASLYFDRPVSEEINFICLHFREKIGRGIEQVISLGLNSDRALSYLVDETKIFKDKHSICLHIFNTLKGERFFLVSRHKDATGGGL